MNYNSQHPLPNLGKLRPADADRSCASVLPPPPPVAKRSCWSRARDARRLRMQLLERRKEAGHRPGQQLFPAFATRPPSSFCGSPARPDMDDVVDAIAPSPALAAWLAALGGWASLGFLQLQSRLLGASSPCAAEGSTLLHGRVFPARLLYVRPGLAWGPSRDGGRGAGQVFWAAAHRKVQTVPGLLPDTPRLCLKRGLEMLKSRGNSVNCLGLFNSLNERIVFQYPLNWKAEISNCCPRRIWDIALLFLLFVVVVCVCVYMFVIT